MTIPQKPPANAKSFKSNKKKNDDNPDDWLITYADAVTLVLCFFIILFSISEPKEAEFKKVSEAFNAISGETVEMPEDPVEVLKEELDIMIEQNSLEQDISVEMTDDGLQLELSSASFYHSGSAKFKREAIPILQQVADILRDFDFDAYEIIVDGHTDDVPIKSDIFPSNWELSAGRATNIVRFFIADGLTPEIMHAAGYAETRPKVPNIDPEGNPIPANRELNRRVMVRVERVD